MNLEEIKSKSLKQSAFTRNGRQITVYQLSNNACYAAEKMLNTSRVCTIPATNFYTPEEYLVDSSLRDFIKDNILKCLDAVTIEAMPKEDLVTQARV